MVPYLPHLSVVVKKLTITVLSGTILHYIWSKLSIIILINWYHAWLKLLIVLFETNLVSHISTKKNEDIQSPICTILMHIGWVALNIWNNRVKPILLIGEKTHSNSNLEFGCTDIICVLKWIWTFVQCNWTNSRMATYLIFFITKPPLKVSTTISSVLGSQRRN